MPRHHQDGRTPSQLGKPTPLCTKLALIRIYRLFLAESHTHNRWMYPSPEQHLCQLLRARAGCSTVRQQSICVACVLAPCSENHLVRPCNDLG